MRSTALVRLGPALLVVALALPGCSSDGGQAGSTAAGSTSSSPFTVGEVPAGYELITAGLGTRVGEWGDDSTGTVEPYTVLSPDGQATGPGVVRVAITGYEGYEGGLAQASLGYLSEHQDLQIGGADAIYSPAADDSRGRRWADLVVVRGPDLAVRVSSPTASAAELTAVALRAVVPKDRTQPPTVPNPPGDLRVIGSADVDGQLAVDAFVAPHTEYVPGPRSAHAAAWVRGGSEEADRLSVLTVPGSSVDLSVVPVLAQSWSHVARTSTTTVVDDRQALILDEVWADDPVSNRRTAMLEAAWGDVVVVTASGASMPSEARLLALAATVQSTDGAAWDRFVVEANGGPGVHADSGRHELARGRIGDVDWLLQDSPPDGGTIVSADAPPGGLRGVDPCLKLSTGHRVCADSLGGGGPGDDWYMVATGQGPGARGWSFVVLSTPSPADAVQVVTPSATAVSALVPVPAGELWAAVVFVADAGFARCDEGRHTPGSGEMRMEALDASGAAIRCLGGTP